MPSDEDAYFWYFIGAMIMMSLALLVCCVLGLGKVFGGRAREGVRREVGESVASYMRLVNDGAEVNSGNLG